MNLTINIESLISGKAVESNRLEFKEGWNPDAIYRTICAFANDFDDTGGGYIVVGVKEENGHAVRPVAGIANSMETIKAGKMFRSRRYRNRRLGEFLKELGLTEGRATGRANASKFREN